MNSDALETPPKRMPSRMCSGLFGSASCFKLPPPLCLEEKATLQEKPTIQDSWRQTDHHWDSNTLHGHQLHRTIQPAQWSRKAGIAGLPTFDIFPWQLAYHGTAEYTARTLSHGKYCGFIATRSVAESVFVTHLLQEIREKRLDLLPLGLVSVIGVVG